MSQRIIVFFLIVLAMMFSQTVFAELPIDISGSTYETQDSTTVRMRNLSITGYPGKYWVDFRWDSSLYVFVPVNAGAEVLQVPGLQVPGQYSTIQAAIIASHAGDVIQVAAGTFNENLTMKDGITIQGSGAGVTVIHGNGTNAVIHDGYGTYTAGFTISGVTIENGTKGVEIYQSIATLSDCIIRNNAGPGVQNFSAVANISNCRISNNADKGIYSYQSTLTVSNSIINSNSDDGISISSCHAIINYTTISGNGGDGIYSSSSIGAVKNSIIAHNAADGIQEPKHTLNITNLNFFRNDCNWSFDYTCWIGTAYYAPIHSILTDPQFVSVSSADFHLKAGSPALTASDSGSQLGAYGDGGNPPD